ncbi:MAG: DUF364 domain-containing protein [Chloroflexota bacterium]|jgi:uncharacterized protein (DUF4213/DUF364 family)
MGLGRVRRKVSLIVAREVFAGEEKQTVNHYERNSVALNDSGGDSLDLLDEILDTLLDGWVTSVLIGLHWTAVMAEVGGQRRCGLASTLSGPHRHHGQADVPQAGQLEIRSGAALAALAKADQPTQASVGVAAINALLPQLPEAWVDLNAEEVLAREGAGKRVALIGHFPFVDGLHSRVGELSVLEQRPQPGDLPASAAAEILPQAEVVAISGTTVINHTLEGLLALCSEEAMIILLGPSTPLSPVLFDHGVDLLCGSVVTDIEAVLRVAGQGGNFRQVRRAGVRTVTMARPGYDG